MPDKPNSKDGYSLNIWTCSLYGYLSIALCSALRYSFGLPFTLLSAVCIILAQYYFVFYESVLPSNRLVKTLWVLLWLLGWIHWFHHSLFMNSPEAIVSGIPGDVDGTIHSFIYFILYYSYSIKLKPSNNSNNNKGNKGNSIVFDNLNKYSFILLIILIFQASNVLLQLLFGEEYKLRNVLNKSLWIWLTGGLNASSTIFQTLLFWKQLTLADSINAKVKPFQDWEFLCILSMIFIAGAWGAAPYLDPVPEQALEYYEGFVWKCGATDYSYIATSVYPIWYVYDMYSNASERKKQL